MRVESGDIVKLQSGDGSQINIRLTVERRRGAEVELKRENFFSEAPAEMFWVNESKIVCVQSTVACND